MKTEHDETVIETVECPKCQFKVNSILDECPQCGIVFKKYKKISQPESAKHIENKNFEVQANAEKEKFIEAYINYKKVQNIKEFSIFFSSVLASVGIIFFVNGIASSSSSKLIIGLIFFIAPLLFFLKPYQVINQKQHEIPIEYKLHLDASGINLLELLKGTLMNELLIKIKLNKPVYKIKEELRNFLWWIDYNDFESIFPEARKKGDLHKCGRCQKVGLGGNSAWVTNAPLDMHDSWCNDCIIKVNKGASPIIQGVSINKEGFIYY